MSQIEDDYIQVSAARDAVGILKTLEALATQNSVNNAALQAIQAAFPAGIPAVNANKAVFLDIGDRLRVKDEITARRAVHKTALQTLKGVITNVTYQTEIQTIIDTL